MNCMKKTISILLSFTMVLSFFTFAPLNVAAEEMIDQLMQQESVDNTGSEGLQRSTALLQESADDAILQDGYRPVYYITLDGSREEITDYNAIDRYTNYYNWNKSLTYYDWNDGWYVVKDPGI